MRRLLAAFLIGLACAARARADEPGRSILDLGFGLGVPLSGLDLARFGGGGERPGGAGFALSPRYLYEFSPSFAVGAELTYLNFPAANVDLPRGSAAGNVFGLEAVARGLLRRGKTFSPYVAGGLGAAGYAVTVHENGSKVLNSTSIGPTFFSALGVKAAASPRLDVSGELRWQLGGISRSEFGTDLYNVLEFFLRFGWRV